ncbi:MAG: hypothetical protein O2923_12160 [Verrucomicrobia bacterium]|nr:hypothetical protein [Verrucomicrobiota bacterium]MDA1087269.1 hypothetical protein [Verrucomicrobiota bacterium]
MKAHFLLIAIGCMAGLLVSCRQETEVRRYREVVTRPAESPSLGAMPDDDVHRGAQGSDAMADLPASSSGGLVWSAPPGWVEEPGKGMRLVTLRPQDVEGDCTIVVLGGAAGGTTANISRWLGQLKVSLGEQELARFVGDAAAFETSSGLTGRLYDFTELVTGDDASAMLAVAVEIGQQTAFVKYTAARGVLIKYREAFLSLCRSLEVPQ